MAAGTMRRPFISPALFSNSLLSSSSVTSASTPPSHSVHTSPSGGSPTPAASFLRFSLLMYLLVRSSEPSTRERIASSVFLPFLWLASASRVSWSRLFITSIGPTAFSLFMRTLPSSFMSALPPASSGKENEPQHGRNGHVPLTTRVHVPATQKLHNLAKFLKATLP